MQTILVATDGSESAKAAVQFAIELAREASAELHVLSVRPIMFHGRGGPVIPLKEVEEKHGAALIAEAAVAQARREGVSAHAHEAHGDEATRIAEAAEELDADLVVVGSHGHGAIGAALFGSVSRSLVRRCKRPVTVVRTQRVREAAKA